MTALANPFTGGLSVRSDDGARSVAPDSLESILIALSKYGEPCITMLKFSGKRQWWARVDMSTTAVGASFKVESEWKQTPLEAAQQCMERVIAAVGRK